jgi:hypothetical protein
MHTEILMAEANFETRGRDNISMDLRTVGGETHSEP